MPLTETLLVLAGLVPGLLLGLALRRRKAPRASSGPPQSARALALEELASMYACARELRAAATSQARGGYPSCSEALLRQAAQAQANAEALRQKLASVSADEEQVLEELRAVRR